MKVSGYKEMRLSKEERIKRGNKIREERKIVDLENTKQYLEGTSLKIKKALILFLTAYVIISFIPFFPNILNNKQVVTFSDYYMARGGSGLRMPAGQHPIIKIATDQQNNYEIQGESMGNSSFSTGDTIVTYKNMLFKTAKIYHKKYNRVYPVDKHYELLGLLSLTLVILFILLLSKSYKIETVFNMLTGTAYAVFLLYLFI